MAHSVLKPHADLLTTLCRMADPALVLGAGLAAYHSYLGEVATLPLIYGLVLVATSLLCIAIFPILGMYQPQRGWNWLEEPRRLLAAWFLILAALAILLFATKTGDQFSRVWVGSWLSSALAAQLMVRLFGRSVLRLLRKRGYNLRYIVLVGASSLAQKVIERLEKHPASGLKVVACFDDRTSAIKPASLQGVPIVGSLLDLPDWLEKNTVDQIWITLPMHEEARIQWLLDAVALYPMPVKWLPDIYSFDLLRHSISEVVGMPVINLTDSPIHGVSRVVKTAEDVLLSGLILLALSPLLLTIALGVKCSSPGPVFYRQRRVTWNGREFWMLKFRSMPVNAEVGTGPVWAKGGDQRATRLGSFLRRWSLDELPQFINVLKGEMSIVGPRPERPELIEQFKQEIPRYMQKHLMKAGITGWAQVNDLRGNTDLKQRIEYDLYYIENWSLSFDLRIIFLTVFKVFTSKNAY